MRKIYTLLFLMIKFICSAQNGDVDFNNRAEIFAKNELEKILELEEQDFNFRSNTPLIKNDSMAINIVEPILFEKYGEKNIVFQRPYNVFNFEHYYVISGTLPKGYIGGTFIIILDSYNLRIMWLAHYK